MIVVFGSINTDLVARVDHLPRAGETQSASAYAMYAGGKGANQALAARRAGGDVAMYGATGRDGYATLALAELDASGIALGTVTRTAETTGIALIHVDNAGQNTITIVAGANALARADSVPDAALAPVTTLLLQLEVPMPEIVALAARARARGVRAILNAAPARALPAELLATIDVLIVNEHEALVIAAAEGLPAAPSIFARTASARFGMTVVVTLGASGAIAVAGHTLHAVPSPAVTVIDTTAAGDAFAGAFAAALDAGAPLPRALARGVAAGALACTREGAQPSLPGDNLIAPLAQQVESTILTLPK